MHNSMIRPTTTILLSACCTASAQAARNIVFMLIDDMRFDVMSCANHPFLQTPAIDSLAASGVRFDRAFVTTSLCSPDEAVEDSDRAGIAGPVRPRLRGKVSPFVGPPAAVVPARPIWR